MLLVVQQQSLLYDLTACGIVFVAFSGLLWVMIRQKRSRAATLEQEDNPLDTSRTANFQRMQVASFKSKALPYTAAIGFGLGIISLLAALVVRLAS
jgi:hypothetical protein